MGISGDHLRDYLPQSAQRMAVSQSVAGAPREVTVGLVIFFSEHLPLRLLVGPRIYGGTEGPVTSLLLV